MQLNFGELKPIQKAIVELIYTTPEELSGDQIFLLLNQEQKNYCYASVYNNIRFLKKQDLLIVIPPHNRKNPSRYQLTAHLAQQLTTKEIFTEK